MLKRRISQTLSLLALNSSWGPQVKWLCSPVMNCHSCPLAWFACPIGVFVHFAGYNVFPFLALGVVLLVGVLLGRLLCGWVCPFGFLQDMLHKIPTRKFRLPRVMSYFKYVVLIAMVFLLPFLLGATTMFSFCRVCPASSIQATIPHWAAGGFGGLSLATVVKLYLLLAVVALAIFSSRSFCKAFCPIGALLAPLNHVSFWFVKGPEDHCVSCKSCDKACIVDGEPSRRYAKGLPASRANDCVVCHECESKCPPGKSANN